MTNTTREKIINIIKNDRAEYRSKFVAKMSTDITDQRLLEDIESLVEEEIEFALKWYKEERLNNRELDTQQLRWIHSSLKDLEMRIKDLHKVKLSDLQDSIDEIGYDLESLADDVDKEIDALNESE